MSASPILQLPPELRQHIYAYLIPPGKFISLPRWTVRNAYDILISSVSHRPPSMQMLTINRQISREMLDYFYSITTWTLKLPDLKQDAASSDLARTSFVRKIKGVELMLWYHHFSSSNMRNAEGPDDYLHRLSVLVANTCEMLLHVEDLKSIVVTWFEPLRSSTNETWEQRACVFAPLRKLDAEHTRVSVGWVQRNNGSDLHEDRTDQQMLAKALEEVLHDRKIGIVRDRAHRSLRR